MAHNLVLQFTGIYVVKFMFHGTVNNWHVLYTILAYYNTIHNNFYHSLFLCYLYLADKPTLTELISLKKTDGSREYLRIIRWIASLPCSECVDFAHLLLVDSVKVKTHQKISDASEFVRAVLGDWLSSGDDSKAVPRTWAALADCMVRADLPGDLVKAIRETCLTGQ